MCCVSMIFDKYSKYENYLWPPNALETFEELVKVAKKLDEVLGLKDCENIEKSKWLEKIKKQNELYT